MIQGDRQYSALQMKKQKAYKDYAFLLKLEREPILGADIVKYTEVAGTGNKICDINEPFKIYLDWVQYDFKGFIIKQKLHIAVKKATLNLQITLCPALRKSIETMKLEQRAWFKVTNQELHQTQDLEYGGCFFEVFISSFLFLNGQTMEAKRKFVSQSRQKGKEHFQKQEFQDALKLYRACINTTQGFPKKNDYSKEDLIELNKMNIKAKQNFIKCFLKLSLSNTDSKDQDLARSYCNQIANEQKDHQNQYLRAAVFFKIRYLSDALESAKKAMELGNSNLCLNLIKKIQKEIEMKKKR